MFYEVNYLVVVAAAAHFVVGAFWYGLLFAKQWVAAHNWTPEQMEKARKGVAVAFVVSFFGSLILGWSVAVIFKYLTPPGLLEGLLFGALFWLGFAVYNLLNSLVYEKKPLRLFLIDGSYHLVGIVDAAGILSLWR